jgi:hypothetical protein
MKYALALVTALLASPVIAQPATTGSVTVPATVIVAIATPPGVPRAAIESGMAKAVPTYAKLPGLIRKYFTIGEASFGGVYLWKSRAAAQAWFTDAWRAKAQATYGSAPQVTYYDVPIVLDGANAR